MKNPKTFIFRNKRYKIVGTEPTYKDAVKARNRYPDQYSVLHKLPNDRWAIGIR